MLRLFPHAGSTVSSVDSISVGLSLTSAGKLWLRYHMKCEPHFISFPDAGDVERADGLWQTTCFEAFLKHPDEDAYLEFNFSPSRSWAAYSFENWRAGQANQRLHNSPEIYLDFSDSHIALEAELHLPDHWVNSALDISVCAVVEESDGIKSYWALAHPPGNPDFHHKHCFALKLSAPVAP